jgi:NAD(P)-dependent dehydrogenase (short-subunit alcohol dehydrogenase family)
LVTLTGAGSGLGYETAVAVLADKRNFTVFATVRSNDQVSP